MARSVFVLLLLALSGAAAAQGKSRGFDYSFIAVSYSNADYDSQNADGDGLGISASFAIAENFHIFGGYAGTDVGASLDASGWRAGGGINMPISKLMDIVVQGFYQTTKIGLPGGGSVDDDGLGLRAGVRVGANDSGNETTFDAGFLLNLSNAFAVGVSGAWDDDVSIWSLDGRLYFN